MSQILLLVHNMFEGQLRSITNKILDVHLMISPVYNFIEEFIQCRCKHY